MSKSCPYCHCSIKVVRIGRTRTNKQRYLCKECHRSWSTKPQPGRLTEAIWYDYAVEDLRLDQICKKYHLGKDKVRTIIKTYKVPPIIPSGRHDVIGMDCTYFGRRNKNAWGILIIVDAYTGECLYCEEIPRHESYAHYTAALRQLARYGIYPKACVIDGVAGLADVLASRGMLVQYCQFHQIKTINTYLTRKPVLEPNIELRKIALSLTHVKCKTFAAAFSSWFWRNQKWLNERTRNPDTGKLEYTHQKTRSAVRSIIKNRPYLFTCEEHPDLNIPNTNNQLEGINSAIKCKLNHHRGARKALKTQLVRVFLSRRTEA